DDLTKENGERFDPETERFVFYRFLDLKTMKGGDYLDLHDTASLQCNFKVNSEGRSLTYNSAFPDAHRDSLRKNQRVVKYSSLPDTIVDGRVSKRVKVNIGS